MNWKTSTNQERSARKSNSEPNQEQAKYDRIHALRKKKMFEEELYPRKAKRVLIIRMASLRSKSGNQG